MNIWRCICTYIYICIHVYFIKFRYYRRSAFVVQIYVKRIVLTQAEAVPVQCSIIQLHCKKPKQWGRMYYILNRDNNPLIEFDWMIERQLDPNNMWRMVARISSFCILWRRCFLIEQKFTFFKPEMLRAWGYGSEIIENLKHKKFIYW